MQRGEFMFNKYFNRFLTSIEDFNLIEKETKKIIICVSGGKDGTILAHFLMEYKKKIRPDIDLEMWTVKMPRWEHTPEKLLNNSFYKDKNVLLQKQHEDVKAFESYWHNKIKCISIPVEHELYENRILKMNWGCILCFCTRMKAINKYLNENPYEDQTLIAFGWTKWDAHYTLISHLLKSDGSKWYKLREKNPEKYKTDCIFLASFFSYPKVELGIPGKKIFRINPLIDFDDLDTSSMLKELSKLNKVPIIRDICRDLFGELFDQDRRYLSRYLDLYSRNQERLNISKKTLLYEYRNLLKFMKESEIMPPLEEIEGLVYDAYNKNFDSVYNVLKF